MLVLNWNWRWEMWIHLFLFMHLSPCCNWLSLSDICALLPKDRDQITMTAIGAHKHLVWNTNLGHRTNFVPLVLLRIININFSWVIPANRKKLKSNSCQSNKTIPASNLTTQSKHVYFSFICKDQPHQQSVANWCNICYIK